jgi:hypothetical protein
MSWHRSGGTESARAGDYAYCKSASKQSSFFFGAPLIVLSLMAAQQSQEEDIYESCMISRGWTAGSKGNADDTPQPVVSAPPPAAMSLPSDWTKPEMDYAKREAALDRCGGTQSVAALETQEQQTSALLSVVRCMYSKDYKLTEPILAKIDTMCRDKTNVAATVQFCEELQEVTHSVSPPARPVDSPTPVSTQPPSPQES